MQVVDAGIALAIKAAGTQGRLAEVLGVSQQAVNNWARQGWVPLKRANEIEAKFGISRGRLANPKILRLLNAPAA